MIRDRRLDGCCSASAKEIADSITILFVGIGYLALLTVETLI